MLVLKYVVNSWVVVHAYRPLLRKVRQEDHPELDQPRLRSEFKSSINCIRRTYCILKSGCNILQKKAYKNKTIKHGITVQHDLSIWGIFFQFSSTIAMCNSFDLLTTDIYYVINKVNRIHACRCLAVFIFPRTLLLLSEIRFHYPFILKFYFKLKK